jgi:excisionase family DNA binding protein
MARANVLTQRAAAKGLGITRATLYRMIAEGKLNRASLNGVLAVKDDATYRALQTERAQAMEGAA